MKKIELKKNKKDFSSFFVMFLILPFILTSCLDTQNIIVPINSSIPIVQLHYTDSSLLRLAGLINDIKPDSNKVLSINSSQNIELITSQMFDSLFKFEKQNSQYDIKTGVNPPANAKPTDLFELPQPIEYDIEIKGIDANQRLDKIVFADCKFRVDVTNAPNGANLSETRYEILQLVDNNGAVTKRNVAADYNLSNCKLTPKYINSKHYVTVRITGKVPPMEYVKGSVIIEANKINSFVGFIGRKVITPAPITFQLSKALANLSGKVSDFYFASPRFEFDLVNDYDVPILVQIDEVLINNKSLKLANGNTKKKFLIKPKSKLNYTFDNSNTENNDLSNNINKQTSELTLKITTITNPTQNDDGSYFATDTNKIQNTDELYGVFHTIIPQNGYIKNLLMQDSFKLSPDIDDEMKDKNYNLVLALSGENEMPFDFGINIYTKDSIGNKVLVNSQPLFIPAAISAVQSTIINEKNMPSVKINKKTAEFLIKNSILFDYNLSTAGADNKANVQLISPKSIKLNIILGIEIDN